jgi:hypothetical protein
MDGHSRDDINRRLDEIQQQLWELGPDEFAARYALQRERDALRDRVRVNVDADSHRSNEDLESELAARRVALARVQDSMVNSAGMSGGGGEATGSFEGPGDGLKLNTEILTATGAQQLVQRIAKLESILTMRKQAQSESDEREPPSRSS